MASPVKPSGPAAPPPGQPDWTVQVADTIESVVASVRDKTAVPLETIARALVYGILIVAMGISALVLLAVALVRVGSYVLPVWSVYALVGTVFTLVGLLLWRKRRPPQNTDTTR